MLKMGLERRVPLIEANPGAGWVGGPEDNPG